jgi:hypothetical protein
MHWVVAMVDRVLVNHGVLVIPAQLRQKKPAA